MLQEINEIVFDDSLRRENDSSKQINLAAVLVKAPSLLYDQFSKYPTKERPDDFGLEKI